MIDIDKNLVAELLGKAAVNPRLRQNFDLRTSAGDGSQRMLNALMPGTVVPIHRHPNSNESVMLLCGKVTEVILRRCCRSRGNGRSVRWRGSAWIRRRGISGAWFRQGPGIRWRCWSRR